MLIVAGDWNAKPDLVNTATRHILGKFAAGKRWANSERLVNFESVNRLVSRAHFQHTQRHLVIWFSNDGRTRNQIDHMLVRSRWTPSVIDWRAYNGALRKRFEGLQHDKDASRRTNCESSKMWQPLPRHISEEPAVTVGTGSLLKRLRWLSKRAWRGFQVRQITGV